MYTEKIEGGMEVITKRSVSKSKFITYGKGKDEKTINLKNILYINRTDKYVMLHSESNIFKYFGALAALEEILPDNFIRIHREYIVNMEYAICIHNNCLKLVNATEIPISRMHREKVQKFLESMPET